MLQFLSLIGSRKHVRANVPKFGISHALSLALGPWLAAEIPYLIETGVVTPSA